MILRLDLIQYFFFNRLSPVYFQGLSCSCNSGVEDTMSNQLINFISYDDLDMIILKTLGFMNRYCIITLNFSLLKDLFDCPYKFKMTNVFGFCSPLNIRMGYGRSIHNILDYIHRNYEKIDYNDPKTVERIVKKYLHLPYGSPKLYKAMTEKATKNLKAYIENNSAKFKYIKFSEKSIDFNIDEYMFINGRIDLVRDELNHTITLVDFKSSSEVLSRDQIKNQLMVYVLGYESLTGEKVDYIESYDFNNSNPITIELVDEDRERFVEKLEECEKNIKNSNYPKATELDVAKTVAFCKELKCDYYYDCHPTER